MFLLFAVIIHALMSGSVQAAFCSVQTGLKCVDTEYTANTCNNNVCDCKLKDSFPIPTGCSKKLDKPTVTLQDPTPVSIVDKDTNVTMVCATKASMHSGISCEWRKNKELLNNTQSEFTVVVTSVNDTGLYSCRIKYGNYYASDESEVHEIALLTKDSNMTLTVSGVPKSAANGTIYNATCNGLPVGKEPTFKINEDAKFNPMKAVDAGNITCVFNNISSPPVVTPSIVSDIKGVTMLVEPDVSKEYIYKTGTNITLLCVSDPHEDYMNLDNVVVNYTFVDVLSPSEVHVINSQTHTLDSTRNHTVHCYATYNNQSEKNSISKAFTFTDFYLPPPVLTPEGSQLLEGSRVVLKCGDKQSLEYAWAKDGVSISLQQDRIIQFDNFKSADAGTYTCSTQKNSYIVESLPVKLSLTTTLSKPDVTASDKEFYEDETYTLHCHTLSATAGMTYTWKKDNTTVPNAKEATYTLTNITSNARGNYSCLATFKNETSESAQISITVEAAILGKPCIDSKDCVGKEYTGECSKDKPHRCKCSPGFHIKEKVCQKSSTVLSSLVLIMAAAILSRLM